MTDERWLTVEQTADRLQVSRWTVRNWLRKGRLRGSQIGGKRVGWRVPESEVSRILTEGSQSWGAARG